MRPTFAALCSIAFPFVAVLTSPLFAQESGHSTESSNKLDEGLAHADGFTRVFVRMENQLFNSGDDYRQFIAMQPEDCKRLELRVEVMGTLKENSERSFDPLEESVEALVEQGLARRVQRYWIVNGFACEATAKGCDALAKMPGVGFVYRQRFAAQQRAKRQRESEPDRELSALYARLLKGADDLTEEAFDTDELEVPWNLESVRADRAWSEHGVTGKGVVVAVLDDGMMPVPALLPALWKNPGETLNGEDDDGNGLVDDVFGYDFKNNTPYCVTPSGHRHGTLCASVVASRPTAGDKRLATGVAPRATIMPLVGNGKLLAYEYALENGADVLSMSYTFEPTKMGQYRGLFRTAHEHLAAAGIVSVGGAGNYAEKRPPGTQVGSPKDIPCVIAAGGVGKNRRVTSFSSRGPVSWEGIRYFDEGAALDRAKPDVTTCNSDFPMWTLREIWEEAKAKRVENVVREDSEGYALVIGPRGNSFAGPHAAGVVALMFEANPQLPAWQVQRLLASTCKDLGERGHDPVYGAGMLQADKAVEAARALSND